MRVLAICGSLQQKSGNLELLRIAAAGAPERVEFLLFDGIRRLPLFNPDLDGEDAPAAVRDWRKVLLACDAILVASPEYGHSLSGALKNAIDWTIPSGELYGKTVAITAAVAAPERGRLGLQALRVTLQAAGSVIVGGEPIVRGPNLAIETHALLRELVERADAMPTDR